MLNESRNSNSSPCYTTVQPLADIFFLSTSIVTTIASIFSNSLLLAVTYKDQRLRSTTNYFIANVGISDMFVPLFELLNEIVFIQLSQHLPSEVFANGLCKTIFSFYNISAAVSVISFVIVAIDRLYAVKCPMKARSRNKKWCFIIICVIWAVSTALYSPYFHFWESDRYFCYNKMSLDQIKVYFGFTFIGLNVSPLLVAASLYCVIIVSLTRQKIPGSATSQQQERRRKQEMKTTKMLVIVLIAFAIGWVIPEVFEAVTMFSSSSSCTLKITTFIATVLPPVHAAANPCIYFIYSENYRNGLRRVFSRCRTRNSAQVDVSTKLEECTRSASDTKRVNTLKLDMDTKL